MSNLVNILGEIMTSDFTSDQYTQIINAAKDRRDAVGRSTAMQLKVGDQVHFVHPKTQVVYTGELKKINRTKAQVKVGFTVWNVPFSLLKAA